MSSIHLSDGQLCKWEALKDIFGFCSNRDFISYIFDILGNVTKKFDASCAQIQQLKLTRKSGVEISDSGSSETVDNNGCSEDKGTVKIEDNCRVKIGNYCKFCSSIEHESECCQQTCFQCDEVSVFESVLQYAWHVKELHTACICAVCGVVEMGQKKLVTHCLQVHSVISRKLGRSKRSKATIQSKNSNTNAHDPNKEVEELRHHTCSMCGKVFSDRKSLVSHINKNHKFDYEKQCSYCNKTFISRYDRKSHEIVVHRKLKCVSCTVCGKVFGKQNTLNRHMRVCYNMRNGKFGCYRCDEVYTSREERRLHQKTVHNEM